MKTFEKKFGHTGGEWFPGHLGSEDMKCQCPYIFGGDYMGGLAEVYIDNGIKGLENGENDCPPKEEATANMHLIAASPELLDAAIMAFENLEEIGNYYEAGASDLAWEYTLATKIALNHAIKKALNQLK